MNFKELDIKRSYISYGENNIAASLIQPCLKYAKTYKRSVGFFSSSVLESIFEGVLAFSRNGGKIQLITSPMLSEHDVEAIKAGYAKRENVINETFSRLFENEIMEFEDNKLTLLAELIAKDILDIKIVITKDVGDYHDKLGILEDKDGNRVVFYGSSNSSANGYKNNYEKVRVVKSWIPGESESVLDEVEEFDRLWNDQNEFVEVYEFKESAQKSIINVVERRSSLKQSKGVTLRDYQEKAIQQWVDNNYHGFFVMATGTGKTWTAIYASKRLLDEKNAMLVICAPYKHLVKQWSEDVEKIYPDVNIIMVSSENTKWEQQLTEEIIRHKYDNSHKIVVISTIKSFEGERFLNTVEKYEGERLLIVDEAHRFTQRPESLKEDYQYMLGLSATPYNGKSTVAGDALMEFFGGKVFDLPIEKAIGKHLVNYRYYPIYVDASEFDEMQFKKCSAKIAGCFRNGKLIDPEGLARHTRARLRVISMAQEKIENIDYIISQLKERDHVVVYCGDGRLYEDDQSEGVRHIQFVKGILDRHEYRPSQFTAEENMYKRMELVDAFNKGEITALAAIRCLDEGINIPSIKSALILSSNDDYREFVQRRGRILRTFEGKTEATIYDVIVMPSGNTIGIAEIELRRFYEYARLALNKEELMIELQNLLDQYGLNLEDVKMPVEMIEEDDLDE